MSGEKHISLYTSHPSGMGCVDIGHFTLQGFTLVPDELLKPDTVEVLELLKEARRALLTPQGKTKTKKAAKVVEKIDALFHR